MAQQMSAPGRSAFPRVGGGWLLFSAVVLVSSGVMRIFDAFWAFDHDDLGTADSLLFFKDDLSYYGWFWLFLGALLIAAGIAVLNGSEWARWFGIFVAAFAAVSMMTWIYAFPIWSMVGIGISLMVVYGLTMYGGRQDY
jgi:hypothetical protein